MALSTLEKEMLDDIIRGLVNQLIAMKDIPADTMITLIVVPGMDSVSNVSINASLKRVLDKRIYYYDSVSKTYHFRSGAVLNDKDFSVKKDHNLLYFGCYNGLFYDFNAKKFNMDLRKDFINGDSFLRKIPNLLKVLEYEWLFNYVDNLRDIMDIINIYPEVYYKVMPKGLFQMIQEQGGFSREMLKEIYFINKYGKFYKIAQMLSSSYLGERVDNFLKICSFENLIKMLKNDLSNGIVNNRSEIYDGIGLFIQYPDFNFDLNRGFSVNIETLENLINQKRNNALAKEMQKLNFINQLQIDDYIIVVPQTQEDKVEEGRMQHNCVGHYYDDRIIKGYDLIYFLRKVQDPNHSYITCRYNIKAGTTVESRKINNTSVNSAKETAIIKQISSIIHNTLVNH